MLEIPRVRTSTYGLRSFRYYAPHAWNDLTDDIRKSDTLATLKRNIVYLLRVVCVSLYIYV